MAKKEESKLEFERTYNVPLRKEFQKVPLYKRTHKAAKALKEFLIKHTKATNLVIGKELNERLWKDGIRNPPHHVPVVVKKYADGKVTADLEGTVPVSKPAAKKAAPKKEETPVVAAADAEVEDMAVPEEEGE